jgi:hypothetical protein
VIPAPIGSHRSAYSFGDRLPKTPLQPSIGVSRHSPDSSGLPTRIAPLIALSNRVRAGREQGVLESPDRGHQSAAGLSAHADSRDGGLRSDRTGSSRQKDRLSGSHGHAKTLAYFHFDELLATLMVNTGRGRLGKKAGGQLL